MRAGTVKRVIDGRNSTDESRRRAGLWIDIVARDGRLYRYLHLGTAKVRAGQTVRAGTPIGTVAEAYTSGAGERAHLHVEVREHDWRNGEYGKPIDPLTLLAA
jgi:murein DD-endopeptidase MepM/ murein hydrolase activator NlpD